MPDAASASVTPQQTPSRLDGVLSGGGLQQALSSAQTNRQEFQKTVKEEILPELRAERQAAEGLHPPAPPPMQPPPEVQPRGQGDAWGSLAMAVAMFGSAFTRQPLTNALNAGAAVNNAFKTQDTDAAKRALEQWKAHSDYAIKLQDFQYQAYRDALSKIGQDRAGTLGKLQVLASVFQDQGLAEIAKVGNIEQAVAHIDVLHGQAKKYANETETENQLKDLRIQALDAQKRGDTEAEQKALHEMNIINASRGKAGAIKAEGPEKVTTKPTSVEITDDSGNTKTVLAQQLASGQWVTADEKRDPLPGTVTRIVKEGQAGGREATLIQRQLVDAKDAISEIRNIAELPVGASTGWLGGYQPGGSLMGATNAVLARKVTSQEVQDYNTSSVGLGRALAGLETGGLQVNQGLMNAFEKLQLNEGDSQLTKARKLASMRQQAENALETALVNPRMGKQQHDFANEMLTNLRSAIPWTPHDVTMLEQSGNPQATLRDFASGQGLGGGGQDSVPVPDAYSGDPDGTGYKKDGVVWVKHGDKLVKTPGAAETPR